MALTADDVQHIANLARLEITEAETDVYREKLTNILDMVDQLSAADTKGVVPMAHPLDMAQRLRVDEVSESDQRNLFQQNASQTEAGLYLVPKVIE
jgi:aspartyl-tRNA(Asn)/glutamyl-tRNA(Gln) amidotransferase subunit C